MRASPTLVVVVLNALVFAVSLVPGGGSGPEASARLSELGGNFAPLTTGGEWWRLLTAVFLHANFMHLAFNMLALYHAGPVIERLFGRAGFVLVYLGAGLAGSAASVFWQQDVVSIGASGAVFGVYGALLAFLLLKPGVLTRASLVPLRASALLFIGYSLLFGFLQSGIDNAAHLGGLGGGMLLGAGLARAPYLSPWRPAVLARALAGVAATGLMVALLLHAAPDSATPYRNARQTAETIARFERQEKALDERLRGLQQRLDRRDLSDAEALDALRGELAPGWDAQLESLAAAAGRGGAHAGLSAELARYAGMRRDSLHLLAAAIAGNDAQAAERARRLHAEAIKLRVSLGRHAATPTAQR